MTNSLSLRARVEASSTRQAEVTIRPSRSRSDRYWILEIAKCPFCEKRHTHGGGSIDRPPLLGFRVAHCFRPVAPGEYELIASTEDAS